MVDSWSTRSASGPKSRTGTDSVLMMITNRAKSWLNFNLHLLSVSAVRRWPEDRYFHLFSLEGQD